MGKLKIKSKGELYQKLKLLMFTRIIFTTFLLGATVLLQLSVNVSPFARPLLFIYGVICGIFLLSFIYALLLPRIPNSKSFAYFQTSIDTVIISLIIYVTGNMISAFSFLYLIVIIYSSILLNKKGGMVIATLCCLQYICMLNLEFFGILQPLLYYGPGSAVVNIGWQHLIYKLFLTSIACYAVAFLSGLLAEQSRKTKIELVAMEDHIQRVEKIASMGEMAAGLAHEIKNPLAALAGSIQLLKEEIPFNPDNDKLMQIVLRETDRLSALVNNFLLFARPPKAKTGIIRIDTVLKEVLDLFEKDKICLNRIIIERKIVLDIKAMIDSFHLRQVLWNLLLNAAEAITGEGKIIIKARNLKDGQLIINIMDNGCGMTSEQIESIFNPFFTTKPAGTGLGLSIVHRILESYDGRLSVQSKVGHGSDFTIFLRGHLRGQCYA